MASHFTPYGQSSARTSPSLRHIYSTYHTLYFTACNCRLLRRDCLAEYDKHTIMTIKVMMIMMTTGWDSGPEKKSCNNAVTYCERCANRPTQPLGWFLQHHLLRCFSCALRQRLIEWIEWKSVGNLLINMPQSNIVSATNYFKHINSSVMPASCQFFPAIL